MPPQLYLSPNSATDSIKGIEEYFGLLVTPRSWGIRLRVREGAWWALDNDCFNGPLDEAAWCRKMDEYLPYRQTCLFVTAPDVVADKEATLRQFPLYAPLVREKGYPVALVTQDGMTPQDVPWDQLDALFIGGSDGHKLGPEAYALVKAAHRQGKWVHVGRVNSIKRIIQFFEADSWDGTSLAFRPYVYAREMARGVRTARAMRSSPKFF